MWSDDILKVMLQDCVSAVTLTGIYSSDTLPKQIKYPAALIVNLSPSYFPEIIGPLFILIKMVEDNILIVLEMNLLNQL